MANRKVWENTPSELTEFGPLSSDVKSSSGIFSWFFKKNKDASDASANSSPSESEASSRDASVERSERSESTRIEQKQTEVNPQTPSETEEDNLSVSEDMDTQSQHSISSDGSMASQRRTLTNVLSRLSSILDRGSSKETDFKQYWMPDSSCRECYDCGDKFTTLRRRHHCRICGQIFCSKCCNQELPGKIMGYRGGVRVCAYCCRVVTSYAQQQGSSAGDLRFSKEDLKNLYPVDAGEGIASAGGNMGNQDSGWWTPVLKKRYTNSLREEQAHHYRSHSSPDISNGDPTKESAPFDISHQTEFSSVENIANESRLLTQNSSQLRELWRQIQHPTDGVEMQSHRFRLKTYQQCITGKELVEWLIKNGKAVKRIQAVAIGQALIYATYLEPICQQLNTFQDDYTLYKPGEAAINLEQNIPTDLPCVRPNLEPTWLTEIDEDSDQDESFSLSEDQRSSIFTSSTKSLQHQTSGSTFYVKPNHFDQGPGMGEFRRNVSIDKSTFPDPIDFDPSPSCPKDLPDDFLTGTLLVSKSGNTVEPFACTQGWRSSEDLHWENGESLAFERLSKVHSEHLSALVCQLLTQEGLSLSWESTIMMTTNMVRKLVSPDVRNEGDDMDIRKYVQIKKIPGGQRNQTAVVNGVVCSKNVAHKKMQQTITNPKILLLKGAIDYQRVENKFSSLDPLILQEREFLKNSVAKVCSLKPDVVVVEKSVCRLAQEFLLEAGITLVFHTKTSVMQRISRSTQAEIVHSIDGLVNKPTLGFCHSFQVKNFQLPNGDTKTLLYFDGCATHLGCTVTLRGSHRNELKRVKKILQLMNYASYHCQLEVSFIMDEFGLPPPPAEECGFHLDSFDCPDGVDKKSQYGSLEQEGDLPGDSDKSTDSDSKKEEAYKLISLTLSRQLVEEAGDSDMFDSDAANQDSDQTDTYSESSNDQTDFSLNQTCDNKTDGLKSKNSGIQELTDFSDPLHNYQNTEDDSIFQSSVALQEQKVAQQQKIRKALEGLVLSVSPYIKIEPPYLESTNGLKSSLRKYFPDEMYFSPALNETKSIDNRPKCFDTDFVCRLSSRKNVEITEAHPFILSKLVSPVCNNSVQDLLSDFRARGGPPLYNANKDLLSDFRARGGRIKAVADGTCHHETPKESNKKTKDSEQKNDSNYVSMYYEAKRDCLDLNNHQHLSVLFSSFSSTSPNAPNPCVNPWIVTMEFYGKNDVTLGAFLERFCFSQEKQCQEHLLLKMESYVCPATPCDTPMVDHVRRFVHENGCITVDLRKLDRRIPGAESNILMWSWCRKCKQQVTPVRMTMDSWSISFAKYLELRFHANMYKRRANGEPCSHSLHHDHFQCFGYRDIFASFKYSTISLREIALPSIVVDYKHQSYLTKDLSREVVSLSNKGMDVYNVILEQTIKLQNEYSQQRNQSKILNEYSIFQKNERAVMKKHADDIHEKLQSLETMLKGSQDGKFDKQGVCFALYNEIVDNLTVLKQMVAEAVGNWNAKIQDLQKKEKSKGSSPSVRDRPPTPEVSDSLLASTLSSAEGSCYSSRSNSPHRTPQNELPDLTMVDDIADVQNSLTEPLAKPAIAGRDSLSSVGTEPSTCSPMETEGLPGNQESPGGTGSGKEARSRAAKKELWRYNSEEQVAEEQEKKRTVLSLLPSFRSSSGNFTSLKMPFEPNEHPLLPKCERVPIIVYDTEPSSIIAYALSSQDYHNRLQEIQSQLGSTQKESPTPSPEYQRRNKTDSTRTYPPKSADLGLNSSPEQGRKHSGVLDFLRGNMSKERSPKLARKFDFIDIVRYNPKLDVDSVESGADVIDGNAASQTDSEKAKPPRKPASNPHIEIQFCDATPSRFYCRVHFAEEFRQLRTLIFPAGEDVFIRSLQHCKHWCAKGGKSRSAFSKTCDNRFILKQMSGVEAEAFQVFAPNYFQYITKAYLEQRPTVLAKILGVYTIGFRNNQTNSAMKQDLLVMENLLYNRKVSQTFDLKGSDSNRLVNTAGKQEEEVVLLDQNFLQVSVGSPLYIRPHSKVVLSQAIASDSQFLAKNLIMDYSLLVGQDDQRRELVVGIIDYIRTFTWDKKIEMVVKSARNLGGPGKMPTVVSPELYKSRFLEAMDRYFPPVPDRWSGLGYGLDY